MSFLHHGLALFVFMIATFLEQSIKLRENIVIYFYIRLFLRTYGVKILYPTLYTPDHMFEQTTRYLTIGGVVK